ncbi:MAG: threonine dehydratase [Dinoroseobacter sp.]|jgi:threonine dehydratase
MTETIPTRDDIRAAHARIAPHIRRTPVLTVEQGALGLPFPVAFKLEHTQITGSFKLRGALNNMLSRDVPEAGIVAASGGNHGAGVAYAATKLGHKSVIFVPKLIAKEIKLKRMRDFGGEVIVADGSVAQVMQDYIELAAKTGAMVVHPYDTAPTLTGQGTTALEIEEQLPDLDTLLVSVGGGGLIGGITAWCAGHTKVVAVETHDTNTLSLSMAQGPDISVKPSGIAAGSLGGPSLGKLPYAIAKAHIDTAVLVSDADVFEAQRRLWDAARLVTEPGAATALAALTSGAYVPQSGERVGVLLCGGNDEPNWFMESAT